MPFQDVVRNLGDAIAGVDRNKAFIEGRQSAAELDQTEANTDLAMETARQRRAQAAIEEQTKAARQRFEDAYRASEAAAAEAAAGGLPAPAPWDPATANIGDLTLGGLGSDYSGAMSGRNTGQQYKQREVVATPEGQMLGDQVITEDLRRAAEDALSPASAVATRRPRAAGAPQVVTDPDDPSQLILIPGTGGDPITVNTPGGPVPARPTTRPSAASQADPAQQRNIDALVARGVDEETAIRIVFNELRDPQATYRSVLNSTRNRFASDEEAEQNARGVVEDLFGPGALETAQEPLIDPPEEYAEGEELVNPGTGQTIVLRNGVWVDKQTGQPVQ